MSNIVSDSLGFGKHQLFEMEAHKKEDPKEHKGVHFKPDPDVPEFIQVHFDTAKDRDDYAAARGFSERTTKRGVQLSEESLTSAQELVRRRYGTGKNVVVANEVGLRK